MEQLRVPLGPWTFDVAAAGPPDGRPVLLLHGFPQSAHSWRHQLAALAAAGYRALAPDLRGYSPDARPTDTAAYRIGELVGDAVDLLDALDLTRVDLVGHDWGAAIAWQTAGAHPERVRSLTAVSVPHPRAFSDALASDPEQQAASAYMLAWREPERPERELLAADGAGLRSLFGTAAGVDTDDVVRRMSEPGALSAALAYYRAVGRDGADTRGPVTAPTLYVWSDGDVALRRVGAETTGNHVAGPYRFEELPGVSHWVPEQAADALTALLLDHLRAT